ncbi:MAG: DnaD domain protein [Bacilli bacterium]|nr:DnaD domain protein [Bacilli bacterium]
MSKISLMPLDTFNVINHSYLNDNDRKLLIMLYEPIVGVVGINLYFNLWTFLDREIVLSETYTHKDLITNMGVTLKEISDAREKLEGLGLLKVYLKEGEINNYIYELNAPLSASDFFANPLLASVLYTSVGSFNYKKIKEYFKFPKINLKEYTNITESFTDVFESVSMVETDNSEIIKKNYAKVGIESELDIEEIISMIPDLMLNHTKVTESTKELILKLSFVYNFDSNKTIEVIKGSINDKHSIDKEKLKINYRNLYQFENDGKLPSIIFKCQPDYLKKEIKDSSKKSKVIYQFENLSPYRFICMKSKTEKPTKAEINILEMLLVDIGLKPGVVNVLIDYVLKINDNKLTKNFVEAIASQWKRSNIETVEQAMEISKQEFKKKDAYKKEVVSKKEENKPEWFDKKIEIKEDLERQKKIEEMLNRK